MHELGLEGAASEIVQACEGRPGRQSPFFFIVGAGISAPTIPLASEIELECKVLARKHERFVEPKAKSPIDTYSHWFELAFPNAEQRQRYLRDKIQGKLISPAVFRLAHLLLSRAAGNIVLTPNFDDFLARALTLFGEQYVICDHPSTVSRVSLESDDIQIVHVHGTYWFYDCCNLKAEIAKRANQLHSGPVTIAAFLEHLLWNRSPIVLGYSGWEGDVIMNALKNRLQTPLPFNLYWFCYKRSDCDDLPDWIRENPNIRLVTPSLPAIPSGESELSEIANAEIHTVSEAGGIGQILPARKVLDLLVKSFTLDSPPLTKNPLQFFADQLGRSVLREEDDSSGVDIYGFQSVVARVQMASRLLAAREHAQSGIESAMEKVRDALRRSDYRGAIHVAKSISIADANPRQLEELIAASSTAAESLGDNSTERIDAYDVISNATDYLVRGGSSSGSTLANWARALLRKTDVLLALTHYEATITACDEIVRRFSSATEPEVLEQVGRALNNKGHSLSRLNRKEEAIRVFDEVMKLFGQATESQLRARAAAALLSKALVFGELKRHQDSIAGCDEVISRFDSPEEPACEAFVVSALANKGWSLIRLEHYTEGVSLFDEVVHRFAERNEPEIRDTVTRSLLNKGVAAGFLGNNEEALTALKETVRRLRGVTKLPLLEITAKAIASQAQIYKKLNQREQMLVACAEILQCLEGHTEESLERYVLMAKSMMSEPDQVVATKAVPTSQAHSTRVPPAVRVTKKRGER
jgi:tetratricopeptide (TPR) repeat protein